MNISGAKAFLAVVSQKSISRAAEILYLTQSTVSFQLKSLEEELGVTLIERRKGYRQIDLTPKGREFIFIAEQFVQTWNEALALQYDKTANLTISSVDSINIYTFASFYQQLLRDNPSFKLKIFTHQTPEIYDQVENHLTDIGFVLSQRQYNNIITKPIWREEMLYVRVKNNTEKQNVGASVHPGDLDFRKEILINWGPEFFQWHNTWCNPKIQPNIQVDTITMLMLFLKGDYWAVLPSRLVKRLEKKYSLFCCPIAEGPPDKVCYKLVHRFPKLSQQAGIEILEKKLDEFLLDSSGEYSSSR
jgi:DNA-binding transcriptional LysR family regulator